jgi:hypothetical protein
MIFTTDCTDFTDGIPIAFYPCHPRKLTTDMTASRVSMNSRQWLGGRQSISPRKKEFCLAHPSLNQQATKQFGLNPSPTRGFVIFGQAAQPQQTFQMLEAQFDLPSHPIHLQHFAGVEFLSAHGGKDQDKGGQLRGLLVDLLLLLDRLLAHLLPRSSRGRGILAHGAQAPHLLVASVPEENRPLAGPALGQGPQLSERLERFPVGCFQGKTKAVPAHQHVAASLPHRAYSESLNIHRL